MKEGELPNPCNPARGTGNERIDRKKGEKIPGNGSLHTVLKAPSRNKSVVEKRQNAKKLKS